jgi:apolipoprotein N-acyltransferase
MKRHAFDGIKTGLLLTALGAAGCGADESNLSTKSSTDPAKLQQAQAEIEQAAKWAQQAEAKKFKGALQVEKQ